MFPVTSADTGDPPLQVTHASGYLLIDSGGLQCVLTWLGRLITAQLKGHQIVVILFFIFFKVYFIVFIYLFYFWLHRVLVVTRRIFIVACGLFRCGAQALRCGAQASFSLWCAGFFLVVVRWLQSVGSVVVAHGLSCSAACGILVPWPGIETASPALESGFFTTGLPGKSQSVVILDG